MSILLHLGEDLWNTTMNRSVSKNFIGLWKTRMERIHSMTASIEFLKKILSMWRMSFYKNCHEKNVLRKRMSFENECPLEKNVLWKLISYKMCFWNTISFKKMSFLVINVLCKKYPFKKCFGNNVLLKSMSIEKECPLKNNDHWQLGSFKRISL